MNRWAKAFVLILAGSVGGSEVQAQFAPAPGPAGSPEPTPYAAPAPPDGQAFPPMAPLSGAAGLPQAPGPFSDPIGGNSGETREGWYMSAGGLGLTRSGIGHMPVASVDPGNPALAVPTTQVVLVPIVFQQGPGPGQGEIRNAIVPVSVRFTTTGFGDTGVPAPPGSPTIGDYNDATPGINWGVKAAIGYMVEDDSGIEFSGFYLAPRGTSDVVTSSAAGLPPPTIKVLSVGAIPIPGNPGSKLLSVGSIPNAIQPNPAPSFGQLDLPFFNAPAGFQGNNGLWLQADQAIISFQSALADFETNVRYYCVDNERLQVQALGGLRYLDLSERLRILTEDDVISVGPTPRNDASYTVRTYNHVLAGQLGCESTLNVAPFLTFSAVFKGAWGVNFIDSDVSLVRGDGFQGFAGHRGSTGFTQVYEIGAFSDTCLFHGHLRVRAGYNLLWVLDVAEAFDQVDFDLSHTVGHADNHGHVMYHGPSVEVQWHF